MYKKPKPDAGGKNREGCQVQDTVKNSCPISLKNIIKSTDFPAIQTLATYIVLCVRHDS